MYTSAHCRMIGEIRKVPTGDKAREIGAILPRLKRISPLPIAKGLRPWNFLHRRSPPYGAQSVAQILTLIVGFYWGGWQTTSSANRIANEQSATKVIAALAPFCVD